MFGTLKSAVVLGGGADSGGAVWGGGDVQFTQEHNQSQINRS